MTEDERLPLLSEPMLALFEDVEVDEAVEDDEDAEDVQSWTRLDEVRRGCIIAAGLGLGLRAGGGGSPDSWMEARFRFSRKGLGGRRS